ncbi:MAG: thiamine phosphate synthase [Verrucomicrobia bacterium]|nr:thiamine phosphate synthase [Verrucomicrobiota bacterium]
MKPLADCLLYTFLDTAYLGGRSPEIVARQLCDGGSDLIQLRAKDRSPGEIRRMAEKILPVTRAANVGLVINDHPEIARDLGADGCHLGQEDFFDAGFHRVSELKIQRAAPAARSATMKVGLSSHGPAQAKLAMAAGANYLAIGPVFATGTKPGAKPVTVEYVRWAAANVTIPWFAIGGICLNNLNDVLAAGARSVCVVSAILNAPNAAKACAAFRRLLASGRKAAAWNREGGDVRRADGLHSSAAKSRGALRAIASGEGKLVPEEGIEPPTKGL